MRRWSPAAGAAEELHPYWVALTTRGTIGLPTARLRCGSSGDAAERRSCDVGVGPEASAICRVNWSAQTHPLYARWLAIGRRVEVAADLEQVRVTCDGVEVARHARSGSSSDDH
ncbi:hypothetical protein [Streptomyces sp. NPDC057696]|uniref:Mu transposase domain-containing protein n=1 Tax=Streptomyces sp. NPDC057696 TaxID=3346218 RepID=UPI00368016D8